MGMQDAASCGSGRTSKRCVRAWQRYLDSVDPEAAAHARARYACFEHAGEDPRVYGYAARADLTRSCEDEVATQLIDLRRRAAEYAHRDGRIAADEFFAAEQNARVVANAERYYRAMFRGRRHRGTCGTGIWSTPSTPSSRTCGPTTVRRKSCCGRTTHTWATRARPTCRLERAIGVIYRPETERISHYFRARLADQFDAVLHFDETRAVEPRERSAEWELGEEPPETYPSGIEPAREGGRGTYMWSTRVSRGTRWPR